MIKNLSIIKKGDYRQILLLLIVPFIILGIAQDLWHAHVKNYHFYWYESLLFKSYWLCFLPFIWRIIQWKTQKNKLVIVFKVFTISILQLILATFFIYWIAALFFYAPFRWQNILNYLFKQHFIETLLIYGVTFTFISFKNRAATAKPEKPQTDFITVVKDKKRIPIKVREIIFLQTNRPYIAIHTLEQRYLSSTTLKDLLVMLDDDFFIRIHKSTVINLHYLKSYISRQNGDYDVLMKNGNTLRLSRTYARTFKEKTAATQLSL